MERFLYITRTLRCRKIWEQLISVVQAERCDLGVAFDGDGDRLGVVDNEGNILWGRSAHGVFARDVLDA